MSEALPPGPSPRSTGRTELWLGPPGRHPMVTRSLSTPSVLPSILQGPFPPHPRPRCPAELAELPPRGIDRLAGDARPQLLSHCPLPLPGYAGRGLRAASSRFRAGQTRLPASRGGGEAAGPSDRSCLATPSLAKAGGGGWGGGGEAIPASTARGSGHPTPPYSCSSSVAYYLLQRALNPRRAARPGGGRALDLGEGGVAVALQLMTTLGFAWRFLFCSRVCCSSP